MARVNRSELTKREIMRHATKMFLDIGYSNTQVRAIAKEMNISPGNLTFHYRTKEDLLTELVELLCDFQWKMIEEETKEGYSSIMAICLELAAMASMCEEDENVRDFYLSAYCSPKCIQIIRKNDAARAKEVFKEYCANWNDEHFEEAEILVSGIEYSTLNTSGVTVTLETRIAGALNSILKTYNVPEETRRIKIDKVLQQDYRELGRCILKKFKQYVEDTNEQAIFDLLKRKQIAQ